MGLLTRYEAQIAALADAGRARRLMVRAGQDFSSNDYLGFASDPRLVQAAGEALARGVRIGSGGSRLLRGNDPEHEALEAEAAQAFGAESALLFPTGYAANVALFATLPQHGDLIVHDALVHASAHDGMRLGRGERVAAAHNDADAFDRAIRAWRRGGGTGRVWIAVESLYSMDGDRAPLVALTQLADRHEAFLLIDEAHATGVFGVEGRGLADTLDGLENVVTLRTLGKALGCQGAIVCVPRVLRDFLVNRSRGLIFSTAPSPLMAAVARAALALNRRADGERARLAVLVDHAGMRLARHGVTLTGSQIMPLLLGADDRAMAVAARLAEGGCDVRGIRPPTVPVGTARLRISITLNVDEAAIDRLDAALEEALR